MRFDIFDEDFEEDLPKYKIEIEKLSSKLIAPEDKFVWDVFVKKTLTNTRNYYIIITSLKTMNNLQASSNFDVALFSSLSFMVDPSFIEMVASIVGKFHAKGLEFARHFGVDAQNLIKHKEREKAKKRKTIKRKNRKLRCKDPLKNLRVFTSKKRIKIAKK